MDGINASLNDVFKTTVLGDVKGAIGSTLFGLNHRQTAVPVPINRDQHGYIFFTRPQLNLSTTNVRSLRRFTPLLDQNELSLPRAIRRFLDPRLSAAEYPCPIVDDKQAFIPILTNHVMDCSGWPDPVLDLYTSRPGVQREVFSLVDSVMENYGAYDLSVNFRNMVGSPIEALIDTWMWYKSSVFVGNMMPYPDFIAQNVVDYQTRIWRLVMDKNKMFVQKIACSGVSIPRTNPVGASFNFESDRPLNQSNDRIQITMHCTGFCYNDPILVWEFNKAVGIFNPDMQNLLDGAEPSEHVRLEPSEYQLFNNRGYPYIDQDTMRLHWYVSKQDYTARMSGFSRVSEALGLN